MIERGFIQRQGNQKLRHEEQLVVAALERRGIPFEFYTEKLINRRQLPLTRTSLVVGDMPCIYGAMKQMGIPIPAANTYPKSLTGFMHRRVWTSTVGELSAQILDGIGGSIFAKPADRQKVFTGQVFAGPSDLYVLQRVSKHQPLVCSETVSWLSEYRVYVCEGEILTIDNYSGDKTVRPDRTRIEAAIAALKDGGEAPAGYGIDFGVMKSGETALVEMNDGFAVGAYAIGSESYARMILARWDELLQMAEPK
jgi:hypothetical protein